MVNLQDEHTVNIPSGWDAVDFATEVLNGAPGWLRRALDIRDTLLSRFGFAVQPSSAPTVTDLTVGSSAGPFTFTQVDEEVVRGGNADSHIWFESSFLVHHGEDGSHGVLRTEAHNRDLIGRCYLVAIWPIHRLLMSSLLRQAIQS